MILLIPVAIYSILILCLILAVNFLLEERTAKFRKRVRKWILITSFILLFPLGFIYFIYLFSIAVENHYDVQKGTFLWYVTMDNRTITQFPIIEPSGKVTFNKIGGDGPSIATGWEIEYLSSNDIESLEAEIIPYLKKEGYDVEKVEEVQFHGRGKKNESNQIYFGRNEKGESLDLELRRTGDLTKIECSIVW